MFELFFIAGLIAIGCVFVWLLINIFKKEEPLPTKIELNNLERMMFQIRENRRKIDEYEKKNKCRV